jgi:hypothetical protein
MPEENGNIQVLTLEELIGVEGGQTAWYYLGFGLGYFAHAYYDNWAEMTNGMGTNMRR